MLRVAALLARPGCAEIAPPSSTSLEAEPLLARGTAGTASVVESSAVLRHVLGSIRKETLMDTQTVIAVCELLLVVIGIVGLAKKDE